MKSYTLTILATIMVAVIPLLFLAEANADKINAADVSEYQVLSRGGGEIQIAAALASLAHDKSPLLVEDLPSPKEQRKERRDKSDYGRERSRDRKPRRQSKDGQDHSGKNFPKDAESLSEFPKIEMRRDVIMQGFHSGVKPGNIVGAIANEIDVESKYIGHIKIYDDFTTVDLPGKLPKDALKHLKKVRVCGKPMNLTKAADFSFDKLKGGDSSSKTKHRKGNYDGDKKPFKKKPRRSYPYWKSWH